MAFSKSPTPDCERPTDIEGFAFAPVCDLDHVNGYGKDAITVKELTETLTCCKVCGRPARYATIKRTAEARWIQVYRRHMLLCDDSLESSEYCWSQSDFDGQIRWTRAERVRSITL